jgi:uncharacterized protein YvpB
MLNKKSTGTSVSQSLSRNNRIWFAVIIWLVVSAVIILFAHAVIAASWTRQGGGVEKAEIEFQVHGAPADDHVSLLNDPIGDSAIPAHVDPLSATPEPTVAWFLLPVLASTDGDLANTSPDSLSSMPSETAFLDVPSGSQERSLSCEYQSAADLASYYGWDTSWRDVFVASGPDAEGDPNRGFVGKSIDDPPGSLFPNGYGVYADPVARGLRRLGIQAVAHRDKDLTWLKGRVSAGHPVVIWATYGMVARPTVQWQTEDGITVKGVPFEHTFTVVGYDASSVWVNNPWNATREQYSWQAFDAAWALLDRMALTIDEAQIR